MLTQQSTKHIHYSFYNILYIHGIQYSVFTIYPILYFNFALSLTEIEPRVRSEYKIAMKNRKKKKKQIQQRIIQMKIKINVRTVQCTRLHIRYEHKTEQMCRRTHKPP